MGFTKKDQFENKLSKVKESLSGSANLEHILSHDVELKMKNQSFASRLMYLTILFELAKVTKKKNFKDIKE